MIRKYEFTDEILYWRGLTLRRIRSIPHRILGGWIEKESNLSHEGFCWVYDNAKVYDDARVFENARVCGEGNVYGNAVVHENSWVIANARVYCSAEVYGNAVINNYAEVLNCSKVYGTAIIEGNTKVYGTAKIETGVFTEGALTYDYLYSDNDLVKPTEELQTSLSSNKKESLKLKLIQVPINIYSKRMRKVIKSL
jgi:hypothetical protein